MGSSSSRPKYFELIEDSKMVIANPTAIADRKKKTGSSGLHQNGCSLFGMIRYSVPSDDWCRVESSTPRITNTTMTLRTICNALFEFEVLQNNRRELQREHRGVQHDAPRDLEHHRMWIAHDQR